MTTPLTTPREVLEAVRALCSRRIDAYVGRADVPIEARWAVQGVLFELATLASRIPDPAPTTELVREIEAWRKRSAFVDHDCPGFVDDRCEICEADELLRRCLTALRAREDGRESLAQELREGLRVRGLWAPTKQQPVSDIITAVFAAIDRSPAPPKETK